MIPKTREEAFKVLELSESASEQGIKKSYRRLIFKWHPDKCSHRSQEELSAATEKVKEVTVAYGILTGEKVEPDWIERYEEFMQGGKRTKDSWSEFLKTFSENEGKEWIKLLERFEKESKEMDKEFTETMKREEELEEAEEKLGELKKGAQESNKRAKEEREKEIREQQFRQKACIIGLALLFCAIGVTLVAAEIIPEIAAIGIIATVVLLGIASAELGGVVGYLTDITVNNFHSEATMKVV